MAEGWVIPLTQVADTGAWTQLYPPWVPAGVNPATATNGQTIRYPQQAALHSIQVKPDGSNGGTIQIVDISGFELGADVSSATAITDAVVQAAITAGKAKLIYNQTFTGTVGSGPINAAGIFRTALKGLAARFQFDGMGSPAGICTLNLVVDGGYRLNTTTGA